MAEFTIPKKETKKVALLQRALTLHRANDLAGAESLYRKLIRDEADNVDALHLCGVVRGARGDYRQGKAFIRRALRLKPDHAAAWSNLGNILLEEELPAEAEAAYRKALEADPNFAPARHNLAKSLLGQQAFTAALEQVQLACTLNPEAASSWLLCGEIHGALGALPAAEAALRRAVDLVPHESEPLTNLANVLLAAGRLDEALSIHFAAVRIQPSSIAWYGLAMAQRLNGQIDEALESIDAAIGLDPSMADAWNLKGVALRALGRFEEAVACFDKALGLRPGFAQAVRHITLSRKAQRSGDEVDRLRTQLRRADLADDELISTGFALGKVLDDLDRCDEAFVAFRDANARMNTRLSDAGAAYYPETFDQSVSDALTLARPDEPPSESEIPVFVVGMPRSGTTLVEQILASHPHIFGAGELPDLSQLVAKDEPMAHTYVERLRRHAPHAARVVDKMPDNILLLGRVASALPKARVILCRRNLQDTALSCFMTRFSAGNAFSYDLWSCGHRTAATARFAEKLAAGVPLKILAVDYEYLVENQEAETRRLIDFIGLDWDNNCLNFHQTARPVLTASAWQVRQPMFQSSIGRWRRYEQYLSPMFDGLSRS